MRMNSYVAVCGLFIQCTFETPLLFFGPEVYLCKEQGLLCLPLLSLSEKCSVGAATAQDRRVNKQTLSFRKEAALHSQASAGSKVENIQPFAFPEGKDLSCRLKLLKTPLCTILWEIARWHAQKMSCKRLVATTTPNFSSKSPKTSRFRLPSGPGLL